MIAYIADTAVLAREDLFRSLYARVSEERRQKICRMRQYKDKCLSLAAELLLIRACKDYGINYYGQHLIYNEHQKPIWEHSPMHFNLSHSHHRALCVTDNMPVGCDVEYADGDHTDIARRYFTPEEYLALAACNTAEEKRRNFYRLWTLKESYMKCTGLGFHLPLNQFGINLHTQPVQLLRPTNEHSYSFYEYAHDHDYYYAACVQQNQGMKKAPADNIQWKYCRIDDENFI